MISAKKADIGAFPGLNVVMEREFVENEEKDYQEFASTGDFNDQTVEDEGISMSGEEVSSASSEQNVPAKPLFTKAIRWLVCAAAFLTPLWFLPFTADVLEFNKQVLLVAITGIGLVLYLIDVVKTGIFKYRPTALYWPVFGLVFAGVISVIFSVSSFGSVFGFGGERSFSLLSLVSLAILFFLAVNVTDDGGKTLKRAITASLALAFIFSALQVFGLHVFKGSLFAGPTFNSVGALNALGILAAISMAFFVSSGSGKRVTAEIEEKSSSKSVLDWITTGLRYVGFVLALFLIVLINWWPVWTVAFVSLLAGVALESAGNLRLKAGSRMRMFAVPMALIVLGIFLMLVNFNWSSIKSKFPIEVAPSQKTSWKIAFESLKSRPLGFGLENFGIAYDKLRPSDIANTVFSQIRFPDASSEVADMAVEGGVLMMLAILSLFWFYGRELAGRFRKETIGRGETGPILAASLGLLVALFLYPFNLALMTVLILLLSLTVVSGGREDAAAEENVVTVNLESSAKYSFAGSLAFIVGLVLVLIACYFTVNNYISNVYLARALESADRTKAIGYFVESANSNTKDAQILKLLSQTIVAQLADDLKAGPKKDETKESYNARIQNQIASAINISLRATNIDPADSQNWSNRGLIYQNLMTLAGGADQAAVNMYNESLKRNPADPLTYLRIGNVYLSVADNLRTFINNPPPDQAGKIDFTAARKQIDDNMAKAEDNFKKAISLYNNYGQALYNLAAVYDREGKLPEAIKQFEKLQATNQRDPSILFQLGLLYYRNSQKDNALNAWQQAVVLFPNYSNARWYLSLVYEERGDLASALNQVQEISKLNPDNEQVQQRLVQLEAGQRTIPPEKVLNKNPL